MTPHPILEQLVMLQIFRVEGLRAREQRSRDD
jgi:hypothetical protein